MEKIEYKPRSAREIFIEMKNISDLVVELAYASVMFESKEIAERVHELEQRMDDLMYHIRIMAAVAARNVDEARKITGILQVASATEAISNATGDIADLILRGIEIHPVIQEAISSADEKIAAVKVCQRSMLTDKTLQELKLPSTVGVFVLAIKRGKSWIVPPTKDTKVLLGDLLIVRGPEDGISVLCKMAGVHRKLVKLETGLPIIRHALSHMRDMSSMMVDLAYSCIFIGSEEIAEEVRKLEDEFDKLNYKIWLETLKAARKERDVARLNSVLQLAKCMEKISDAADSIADVVLRKVELHPVFARALGETDEQVTRVYVSKNSPLAGKTLGDLNLWIAVGAYVLAIKRGDHYIFDPGRNMKILAGDSLIARGSYLGVQKLKKMAG
jgi:uncharacterized protein with PhoU and TrkA domain